MNARERAAWFMEAVQDTKRLRWFAGANVWFWLLNLFVIDVMFFTANRLYKTISIFYLVNISILALVESSLSWWQSARVEEKQDEELAS